MARNVKNQYIGYYAAGSAAQQLERQPDKNRSEPIRHSAAPALRRTLYVDPVAVLGTVVMLALLVCMIVGAVQLNRVNAEIRAVESLISELEIRHDQLEAEYDGGCDLAEIREQAQALGMVDSTRVQHITVTVPQPTEEAELSWWENLLAQIRELFA